MQLAWKPSPLLLTPPALLLTPESPPAPIEASLQVSPRQRCTAVPAKASLVPPELESDRRQAEVLALRFAVGDAVECYIDGCFHRGTVVALSHRNDNVVPVCLSSFRAARLLALYHRSYFTHSHPHRDGRLVGWRRRRTRSCSTRAASSGHHPILMASSAQGAPGYRHRRAAAARHERPFAAAAAAAAAAGAMPGAEAAIGAGAASAAPAALAAGTAAAAVTVTMRAVPAVAVIFGRKIGATSATTRATASATDRRSGRSGRSRPHRRLWRRPHKRAGLSIPLSKN